MEDTWDKRSISTRDRDSESRLTAARKKQSILCGSPRWVFLFTWPTVHKAAGHSVFTLCFSLPLLANTHSGASANGSRRGIRANKLWQMQLNVRPGRGAAVTGGGRGPSQTRGGLAAGIHVYQGWANLLTGVPRWVSKIWHRGSRSRSRWMQCFGDIGGKNIYCGICRKQTGAFTE